MLGVEVPMFIDGEKVYADEKTDACSPVDTPHASCARRRRARPSMPRMAVAAAKAAARLVGHALAGTRRDATPRGADHSRHNFELSAIMALEVGKSRLEALGEVEETADLLRLLRQRHGEESRLHQ